MDRASSVRSAGFVGSVSAALLGLLPKLTCPLCWPVYSAALGAVGVGFVDYTPYLLPVTATFIGVAIAALTWKARVRHSLLPVAVGSVAGVLLLVGKFALDSEIVTYGAAALFLAAPLLPVRRFADAPRSDCECGQTTEVR